MHINIRTRKREVGISIPMTFMRQVFIAVLGGFFVGLSVYAATTIGNNVNTGGTLDVTGLSTFSRATSTSATTTDYLYVGFDVTEPAGWNFAGGDLLVSGNAFFNSQATSSASFWIGSGGTGNWINLAGGDLFVQDGAEIDGGLFFSTASGTSATTTAYLMVGDGSPSPTFNYVGDLWVQDKLEVGGRTTSTGDLVVGSESTAATTTIKMKANSSNATCLEWVSVVGTIYREYVNGSGAKVLQTGACK